ncbi:tRNA-binding protein [Thermodesulfomicrobium sp. WS]|uniref:tRNA-binding protein n=1 Tax=Thermodesulfomicrobium sp. WS TaxID=3004129 RepID=UPI00248F6BEF|nr:tRNA-binding protein [Thermodesulfomicrobium sp. WS]BDV02056.1 tRNA-binding protein [Thermodesulfomicrobium sp. WS]
MHTITWQDFAAVELRVGRIVEVHDFPEARIPAYRIRADFGPPWGIKTTSARVTALYTKEALLGRLILGVLNLPPKRIGPVLSEFLLTGFAREDGAVVLAVPEQDVPVGARLF